MKAPWSIKENETLKSVMNSMKNSNWSMIAKKLNLKKVGPQRTGKQCRERWRNHLDPGINKYCYSIC